MFGFPSYSRPANFSYNRNFLRSVVVQIKYSKNNNILDNKKLLVDILSATFPNHQELKNAGVRIKNINNKTQFIPQDFGVSGILFQTKDALKSINVSEESLVISFDGSTYTNIEKLWDELQLDLNRIFETILVKELVWISVRKINLIQFEVNENVSPIEGLRTAFNSALIGNFISLPGNENLINAVSNITLKNNEQNLNLTFGLIPSKEKDRNIILDIDIFLTDEVFAIDKLKEKLFDINSEIFNIFNWSLQESVINELTR